MIQKTLRGTIQLLGGLGAGLAIVVVLLAWRLTSGPISLAFLSPYIQEAANREAAGFTVEFDDTILTWAGWERTLDIRVINIRAKAPGGQVLATVPEVSISLSIGGMFHGLVAPRSIELFGPALHLTRHADGHFGIESDADGASGALVADLLARLAAPPNPDRSLGYLSRVSIHRGSAMVNDIRSDMVWFAPSVEATFERDAKGINAEVTTDVRIGDDFVKAVAIGRYHPKDDRVDLGIEVSHLVPAKLANASAIFEPLRALDLPIHGTLVTSVTGSGTIESVDFDLTADAGTLALPAPMAQNLPITSATVSGRLDGINRTWEIDELNLVLPDGATLVLPEANGYAAPLASVAAAGRFDERTGRMEIERLNLDLAGPKLSVRATVDRIFDSPAAGVSAVLTDMPIDSVGKYWPKNWGPDIREWIVPNMSAGMVKETRLRTTLHTKDDGAFELIDVAGTMKIDNATIDYFAPLPKATHAYGTGVFSHEDFTITVDRGEAAGLQVKGGTLHFKDFQKYDQTLDIDLLIHGPFRNALKLLDQKPLGFAKDLGIDPETAKGTSATNLHLDFPLIDALTFDGVNVSAAARLTDVALPDIVLDRDVTNGDLEVRVDKTAMEVTGKVDIGTVTADLKWKESFDKKVAQQSAFRLAGTVDDTQWIGEFGLDFPPFSAEYLRGAIPFEILWQTGRDGSGTLDANLDLAKATLTIPFLDWSKPPGVAGKGHAQLTLKDEKVTGIPAFDLSRRRSRRRRIGGVPHRRHVGPDRHGARRDRPDGGQGHDDPGPRQRLDGRAARRFPGRHGAVRTPVRFQDRRQRQDAGQPVGRYRAGVDRRKPCAGPGEGFLRPPGRPVALGTGRSRGQRRQTATHFRRAPCRGQATAVDHLRGRGRGPARARLLFAHLRRAVGTERRIRRHPARIAHGGPPEDHRLPRRRRPAPGAGAEPVGADRNRRVPAGRRHQILDSRLPVHPSRRHHRDQGRARPAALPSG